MNTNQVSLNWSNAQNVFPLEEKLRNEYPLITDAKNSLISKNGKSSEYTEWFPFIKNQALNIIEKQKSLVDKISAQSDAVVIIGIGGSLLGAKAVYEALSHSFHFTLPSKNKPSCILFWAGHHVAQNELIELCETLESYSPSIVVISKSGGTVEPALSFRILREYLYTRYGEEETNKRIVVITDPENGQLLTIAKENNYPYFSIPKGIGGRYSVFTSVGLFPLALAGINVNEFIQGAIASFNNFNQDDNNSYQNNPALCYAGIRNILYKNNYKIEALCTWSPKEKGISEWWKQLFGESDGKEGTGIFPASSNFTTDLHSLGQYFQDGERILFATHLQFNNDIASSHNDIKIPSSKIKDGFEFLSGKKLSFVQKQAQAGTFLAHSDGKVPTLVWEIPELSAFWLGAWMFTNMVACAVGGYARKIDPFNQPGVEGYKNNMFALMNKPWL